MRKQIPTSHEYLWTGKGHKSRRGKPEKKNQPVRERVFNK